MWRVEGCDQWHTLLRQLASTEPGHGAAHLAGLPGDGVWGSIMVVHGVVVVGAGTQMVAMDSATGKLLFTFQDNSAGSQFVASATIINGMLYLGNEDGKLYAFGL